MVDAALKEESWFTPLLRLVGRAPDQIEAEREFKENLRKVEEQTDVLDDILMGIDKINESARDNTKKSKDLHQTLIDSSPLPPPMPNGDDST